MSYTKQTWETGDTITAEKLNHMEDGIGGGAEEFLVTLTPTSQDLSGTMDKTLAEITEAYNAGKELIFKLVVDQVTTTLIKPGVINLITYGGATLVQLVAVFTYTASNVVYLVRAFNNTGGSSDNTYTTAMFQLSSIS